MVVKDRESLRQLASEYDLRCETLGAAEKDRPFRTGACIRRDFPERRLTRGGDNTGSSARCTRDLFVEFDVRLFAPRDLVNTFDAPWCT